MAIITKTDLELELQITFSSGYTDAFFTDLCTYAEDYLKLKTNRATFSGVVVSVAKYAELVIAIDRLATSNRDIIKAAISSISENGASINFANGKTLESYRADFNQIVNDLKIPLTSNYSLTIPDINNDHTGTEGNILY